MLPCTSYEQQPTFMAYNFNLKYCILFLTFRTIRDVVSKLREQVTQENDSCTIIVRRAHVLEDALRNIDQSSFNPLAPIIV